MREKIRLTSGCASSVAAIWMSLAVINMPVSEAVAQPSDDHVHLADAATWAVSTSNTELLKSLLQAGVQINEPVEKEAGWTLLHFAASSGTERLVRFLIDSGADPSRRDHAGLRPIDLAYQQSRTNICQALANTRESASSVDGFPEGVLETVFRSQQSNAVIVSINGKDPSGELLKWLRRVWPNAIPGSKGELVTDTASGEKHYRNIESKEKLASCAVTIKRLNEREYSWFMSFRSGPLSGWHDEGKAREEYGYWLVTETKGGQL